MGFRFEQDESVIHGLRRIAREQLDKAARELQDDQSGLHETVHQVRKRCKKLRGLIRLARPALGSTYKRENKWYRDTARRLSTLRDAYSIIATWENLKAYFGNAIDEACFDSVGQQLRKREKLVIGKEGKAETELSRCLDMIQLGLDRVDSWMLASKRFEALRDGLQKTYGRGRAAMWGAIQHSTAENFHQWRKRTKYHWYHVRLLKPIWPKVFTARAEQAHRLSDLLGDEHDLAVLREAVARDSRDFGERRVVQVALGLIDQRRCDFQAEAESLGRRLYCEKPKQLGGRFQCSWRAWRADGLAN